MDSGQLSEASELKPVAAYTKVAVNLRLWPAIADNIIRLLPAGTNVSIAETFYASNGNRQWYYVTGGDFHGWVDGEFLKSA